MSPIKQTPIENRHNTELLALMPTTAARVVEVGCGGGALAREYAKLNPACDYIGIEVEPEYAALARAWCSRVITGNIESIDDPTFDSLFPCSCWVFADVLEHLWDPWSVLRRIRQRLPNDASIIACIPNAQHWSFQARLNCGALRYEASGLLDRTHIRWFTRATAIEMFQSTGFEVVDGGARLVEENEVHRNAGLAGVRAMAEAIGGDMDAAVSDAIAFQWIICAAPARQVQTE
jgi:SAM-dependent methyltransferase